MVDLTGTWLGTYWQRGQPTRFEATLVQGGNSLSGRILDDSDLGEASLNGDVTGRSLSFVKRYLTSRQQIITYHGTVSEDGDRIQGEWQISGFDRGLWEAHRSQDDLAASLAAALQLRLKAPAWR